MDDKSGIGTVVHVLYTFSKPPPTGVSYPIRAGKFSKSNVSISDWIVCGAGRFKPLIQAWRLTEFSARSAPISVQAILDLQTEHFAGVLLLR